MSEQINWTKLVSENRAKAIGIPWTEEELEAIYKKKIHPDDVRNGVLDVEKEDTEEKSKEKPIHHWKKDELIEKAKELGISFSEEHVGRADLILEINKILKSS